MPPPLKKIVRAILLAPVVLILLFEEWGWGPLARGFAALARLSWWGRLERWIIGLPPWAAVMVFGLPVLTLLPLKLLALYLFGQGHAALGLGLIVAAKLSGTAVAARLFQLTQPALMQLSWFARLYTPWKIWKDRMLTRVRKSSPWRSIRYLQRHLNSRARRLWAALRKVRL